MTTTKLMLNKARQLNDGTYPLIVQLLHQRRKRVIYLGIYLHPDEFDECAQQVMTSTHHYRRPKVVKALKQTIVEALEQIHRIIARLEQHSSPYTCNTIVDIFRLGDLAQFWQEKINQQRQLEKFGIANAQQYTFRSVMRYAQSQHIGISNISPDFVHDYERHLHEQGLSPNTVCYYMRNFKTILSWYNKEGYSDQKSDLLFDGIKTSPRKTVKRAISSDELRRIAQTTLKGEPLLQFARDMFMFSFYTRGMSFVDIAFLRHSDLSSHTLCYARRKTGRLLRININEPMRHIITTYSGVSQYLFPLVISEHTETAYRQYRSSLRKMNNLLKMLGERLHIETPLTTYVARHSWATQAKQKGFAVSVISEGLGHGSERITQIYLKEFDNSVLDKANDIIVNL